MTHSADNYNKVIQIIREHELEGMYEHHLDFSACVDEICELIGRIENAECQKGKDIIKEEIGEIITQVEKNNHPDDPKYWENLYCELRNAIVRIDTEL